MDRKRDLTVKYQGETLELTGMYYKAYNSPYCTKNGDPPMEPSHDASFSIEKIFLECERGIYVDISSFVEGLYVMYPPSIGSKPIYTSLDDVLSSLALEQIAEDGERTKEDM